jgi:hypothetical protein
MVGSAFWDSLGLWTFYAGAVVINLILIEGGYRFGRFRLRNSSGEMESPVGGIIAATLALLGLILAFTFNLAADRFNARREIVVQEANAIGTAWLRAGLLPDTHGAKVRQLLRDYVDIRLEVVQTRDIEKLSQDTDRIHRLIWQEVETVGREQSTSITTGLTIQAINDVIDIHSERVLVGLQNSLPTPLWGTLYLVTGITMAGVGYHAGLTQSRRSPAILILVISFCSILTLAMDLDQPQEGYLRVSQQAIEDLKATMGSNPDQTP